MLLLWFVLSLAQSDVETRLNDGSNAFRDGKYAEVVEILGSVDKAALIADDYACYAYATSLQYFGRIDEALIFYDALPAYFTRFDIVYYNRACIASSRGDQAKALDYLLRAYRSGFIDDEQVQIDPDLAGLRKHPGFFVVPKRQVIDIQLDDGSSHKIERSMPLFDKPTENLLITFSSGNQHPRARRHAGGILWGFGMQEQGWQILEVGKPEISWFSPLGKQRLKALMDHLINQYGTAKGYHVAGNLDGGSVALLAASLAEQKATSLALVPGVPRPDFEAKDYQQLKGITIRLVYHANFPAWWHQQIDQFDKNLASVGVDLKRFQLEHYYFNFIKLRRGGFGPFLLAEMDDQAF